MMKMDYWIQDGMLHEPVRSPDQIKLDREVCHYSALRGIRINWDVPVPLSPALLDRAMAEYMEITV